MIDLSQTVIPKSDQTNADDLISGPRTITITAVKMYASDEQPVGIHYENDGGRPYKPNKSMRRVLIAAWGPDGAQYVGRAMTIYLDRTVTWGGAEVGGIRISHLSHIERRMTMALTATKKSRKAFVVDPLLMTISADQAWLEDIKSAENLADLKTVYGTAWKASSTKEGKDKMEAAYKKRTAELNIADAQKEPA